MIAVLVPELEALLKEAGRVPARLAAIMHRARPSRLDPSAAGSELVAGQPLMAGPLTRLADRPDDAAGIWMRADPVGLVPDLGAVWMRPGALLDPGSALAADVHDLLADHGFDFDLPAPQRGYLRLKNLPDCGFSPPWMLDGESMEHVLPSGADQKTWRHLLNEVQILMHDQGDGTGSPGGLWFWGAGALTRPGRLAARISHVCCQDPALIALADWLGLSHGPPGATTPPADNTLIEYPVSRERSADDNLAALERWLKPLWRRLKTGRIKVLELASRERVWQVTPAAAWRLWQRPERP